MSTQTNPHDLVTPYQSEDSKKRQVTEMFDNIAPKYDLLNHLLTLGIDIQWRKKAIKLLRKYNPQVVVDIATGTGDFAVAAMKLNPKQVIAIDISPGMIEVGRNKIAKKGLSDTIEFRIGDSEKLELENDSADAVTVGFGARNFENLEQGLSEIHRVLRKGGAAAILEPAYPNTFPLKQMFNFYFRVITPLIGKAVSGDNAAYTYLPESVKAFPNGKDFVNICEKVGFSNAVYKPLTLGSCSMYILEK